MHPLMIENNNLLDLVQAIPFSFAALFPVLNPLGTAVIFLSLTVGASQKELSLLSKKIAINTALLLIIILFTGTWILRFFGINIPIVQVSGGLVIAYIGWSLLNQPATTPNIAQKNIPEAQKDLMGMAFFPLTMPLTAGPGCIAITLTIGAHQVQESWTDTLLAQAGTVIGILLASLTVFLCYNYAYRVTSKLKPAGIQVIIRLAAFINLCIGLEIVWHGIQGLAAYFM